MAQAADERSGRTMHVLRALSLGDALGERLCSGTSRAEYGASETLPGGPWRWTDDTLMACSIVDALLRHHTVRTSSTLLESFSEHFDASRGYSRKTADLLVLTQSGASAATVRNHVARTSSAGNGAAMRVAPLGAWFADQLDQAMGEAERSAIATHTGREAIDGAVAVAAATALVWQRNSQTENEQSGLLNAVAACLPRGAMQDKLEHAAALSPTTAPALAAKQLGDGRGFMAITTVPFALWCAIRELNNPEGALWCAIAARHDCDTASAIAVSVTASGGAPLPATWLARVEPLPPWLGQSVQ